MKKFKTKKITPSINAIFALTLLTLGNSLNAQVREVYKFPFRGQLTGNSVGILAEDTFGVAIKNKITVSTGFSGNSASQKIPNVTYGAVKGPTWYFSAINGNFDTLNIEFDKPITIDSFDYTEGDAFPKGTYRIEVVDGFGTPIDFTDTNFDYDAAGKKNGTGVMVGKKFGMSDWKAVTKFRVLFNAPYDTINKYRFGPCLSRIMYTEGGFTLPTDTVTCEDALTSIADWDWSFSKPTGDKYTISVESVNSDMIENTAISIDSTSSNVGSGETTNAKISISKISGSGTAGIAFNATNGDITFNDTMWIIIKGKTYGDTTDVVGCNDYTWNDSVYTSSGIYSQIFTGSNGCDSFAYINVKLNKSETTSTVSACGSYEWEGNTYTESGQYKATYTNASSCDSVLILNLTINTPDYDTTQMTSCFAYEWNGVTYTQSGLYTDTFMNVNGCDSFSTLELTINSVNTGVQNTGATITASSTSGTFQWLDCENSYAVIDGATSNSYTATVNGDYAVEITDNGCVDTSDCTTITGLRVVSIAGVDVQLFPNPTTGELNVTLPESMENVGVNVFSSTGQLVNSVGLGRGNNFNFSLNVEKGIYWIQIVSNNTEISKITVVKQ